ncbi:MAG: hypothetical protein VYC17_03795, partial [Nitrospinota bacterium]|nr:hypothetical protein [Nitrospinota bacterium]
MMSGPPDFPPKLFVFLGASNLARGHIALARCLQKSLYPRPARFLFALGPGRGYCAAGGVMHMVYSPIKNSKVFSVIRENAEYEVVALVSDIGNDIMYNVSPGDITACLKKIFQQLRESNALILAIPIPSGLETGLSNFSFLCLRSMFFPTSRVSRPQAVSAIRQINEFLQESVAEKIKLLSGLEEFSGWDKIHYSLWRGHFAWESIAQQILQV